MLLYLVGFKKKFIPDKTYIFIIKKLLRHLNCVQYTTLKNKK